MKRNILLLVSAFLICLSGNVRSEEKAEPASQPTQKGKIMISCTPDLQGLVNLWTAEYRKINPAISMEVGLISTQLPAEGGLALVSGRQALAGADQAWKMTVGRDVTVPVISTANPHLDLLSKQGVTPEGLAGIFRDPSTRHWGSILRSDDADALHLYMVDDGTVDAAVVDYLGLEGIAGAGITRGSAGDVLSAVQQDPQALVFCRLTDLTDPATGSMRAGILLMPIDKNANGRLDYMEKITDDLGTFSRGVWIGKYPPALVRDIYIVSTAPPQNESEVAFLSWILTVGQPALFSQGFSELVNSERQSQLDKLLNYPPDVIPSTDATSVPGLAWYILIGIVLIGAGINAIVRRKRRAAAAIVPVYSANPGAFSEISLNVPAGLSYDKTHTWAIMEKDGKVRVGIDDFLQHVTGPITRVELKKPGERIKKGQSLLSIIQKGKLLTIYAPVSGIIREANQALLKEGARINRSPYGDGWAYTIEPSHWAAELPLLQMAEKYKNWVSGEFTRLKEFLAASLGAKHVEMSYVILQDGGELKDQTLSDLGPEIWEDFQCCFLDRDKAASTSN